MLSFASMLAVCGHRALPAAHVVLAYARRSLFNRTSQQCDTQGLNYFYAPAASFT